MSTTNGNMKSFKVTDKAGNVYVLTPVDTVARQAIDEAKNLQFDDDYFTSEVSQDQKTVNIGLNGVPVGVESPLKFVQDTAQGIVIGSDSLTGVAPGSNNVHVNTAGGLASVSVDREIFRCTIDGNDLYWNDLITELRSNKKVVIGEETYEFYKDGEIVTSTIDYMASDFFWGDNTFYDGTAYVDFVRVDKENSKIIRWRATNSVPDSATSKTAWTKTESYIARSEAIAPDYDPTDTYPTVGTAVMFNGKRYVNNTAIDTAEEWTPAHWTETSVEDVIGNVETLLAAL